MTTLKKKASILNSAEIQWWRRHNLDIPEIYLVEEVTHNKIPTDT